LFGSRSARALLLPLCLAALLGGGCASIQALGAAPQAPASTIDGPITPGVAAPFPVALGVQVEIIAPPALKNLLERNLDVVRLGRIAREEIDDSEWTRLIDAAPAQVKELLQTEGYFAPTVALERQARRASGEPDRVVLRVEPGVHARVTRVTLEVEGDLEREAAAGDGHARETLAGWRAAWPLPTGSEFRNPSWNQAKATALARLRAAGYATANWSGTAADVDLVRNEVRLFLVVDSGPLFRFGQLQIDGLVSHDAETVRHLAHASRGTPVTETLLLDFQERLQKSRLFESINVFLDPEPASAADASVVVRLREAPLQAYTVGLGVSANTGLRTSLEHVYRRVFGLPAVADNKFEWAQKRRAWDGEISSHPGKDLYRNLLGGAVEWLESDDDVVLSQRLRAGRTRDTTRFEQIYFLEGERSKRTTEFEQSSTIALSANYHGVWRKVDSVLLPTDGFTFAGQVGVGRSHGTDSEHGWFTRAYGRFTGYLPFGGSWYGQGRLEVGQVFIGQNVVAPESQRWRAGGDDSVRGYEYRSLGPIDNGAIGSGNAILTTSVEVARPISASLPSVWGALFVDAGNAANGFSDMKLALGYGVGVRWRSPVGPLRFDLAYGHEEQRFRLHFSVGIVY
jgi:translocation and assembly module TamA